MHRLHLIFTKGPIILAGILKSDFRLKDTFQAFYKCILLELHEKLRSYNKSNIEIHEIKKHYVTKLVKTGPVGTNYIIT